MTFFVASLQATLILNIYTPDGQSFMSTVYVRLLNSADFTTIGDKSLTCYVAVVP